MITKLIISLKGFFPKSYGLYAEIYLLTCELEWRAHRWSNKSAFLLYLALFWNNCNVPHIKCLNSLECWTKLTIVLQIWQVDLIWIYYTTLLTCVFKLLIYTCLNAVFLIIYYTSLFCTNFIFQVYKLLISSAKHYLT